MSLSPRGSSRSRLPSHRLAGAGGKVSICIPEVSHRLPRLHIKSPVASATPLEVKEGKREKAEVKQETKRVNTPEETVSQKCRGSQPGRKKNTSSVFPGWHI